MRRLTKLFLISAAGVALLYGLSRRSSCVPRAASSASEDTERIAVQRCDLVETVSAPGSVRPANRTGVRSPVRGRLEELSVAEGSVVTNGQRLGWISTAERAALLDAARLRGDAELTRWKEMYRPVPLLAPTDGIVMARLAEPGQYVGPEADILVLRDRLVAVAQVDEADIARVATSQWAVVTLDAYPGLSITGRVSRLAAEARTVNGVALFDAEVDAPGLPRAARVGLSADCIFQVGVRKGTLVLPEDAVRGNGSEDTVSMTGPGGRPFDRPVRTGARESGLVEILSGLHEGDMVHRKRTVGSDPCRRDSPIIPITHRAQEARP